MPDKRHRLGATLNQGCNGHVKFLDGISCEERFQERRFPFAEEELHPPDRTEHSQQRLRRNFPSGKFHDPGKRRKLPEDAVRYFLARAEKKQTPGIGEEFPHGFGGRVSALIHNDADGNG